jgi:hypothetical protein
MMNIIDKSLKAIGRVAVAFFRSLPAMGEYLLWLISIPPSQEELNRDPSTGLIMEDEAEVMSHERSNVLDD